MKVIEIYFSMITFEVTTPKECLEISYGFHSTLFGKCFIGMTAESISHLSFVDGTETSAIATLKKEWPKAHLKEDLQKAEEMIQSIFVKDDEASEKLFRLLVKGTDFQVKVWQALISIPKGATTNYENIAQIIGKPKAVRATANAIANNKISYLIPCHRVVCKSGKIHKYRWGSERKKAMLTYEKGQT